MTDPLTSSEAQVLRILRALDAVPGAAVTEHIVKLRWGRGVGVSGQQDFVNSLFSLQFKGLVVPGPGVLGNLTWALTDAGLELTNTL